MSMPNRFCVIERRLDIIEARLGIENDVDELNRSVIPKKKDVKCTLNETEKKE